MTGHAPPSDVDAQSEIVEAYCRNCGDVHPVSDRRMDGVTTVCPHCGDPRYTSQCDADPISKSHAERIKDAVRDVHGVGEQTCENIIDAYDTYYAFEAAGIDELTAIDGVGTETARRIDAAR